MRHRHRLFLLTRLLLILLLLFYFIAQPPSNAQFYIENMSNISK